MKKNFLLIGCIVLFVAIVVCVINIYNYLNTIKTNDNTSLKISKIIPKKIKKPKAKTKENKYLLTLFNVSLREAPSILSKEIKLLDPFTKIKEIKKEKKWIYVALKSDNITINGWLPDYSVIDFSFFKIKRHGIYYVKNDNSSITSKPDNNFKILIKLKKNTKIKILDTKPVNNFFHVEVNIDNALIEGWIKINDIYNPNLNNKLISNIKKRVSKNPYITSHHKQIFKQLVNDIKNNFFFIATGEKIPKEPLYNESNTINPLDNNSLNIIQKDNITNISFDNKTFSNNHLKEDNKTYENKKEPILYFVYIGPFPKYKDILPIIKKLKANKIEYFIAKRDNEYFVHLGSYRNKEYLLDLENQLKKAGIENAIVKTKTK